jgi:hypothetical protein
MRTNRYRTAALLLAGGLLTSLAGCGHTPAPAAAGPSTQKVVARGKADDAGDGLKAAAAKEPPKDEAKKEAEEGFRFPDDKGGQLLAKVLPPSEKAPAGERVTSGPKRLPGSPALEQPAAPLPPGRAEVPRLPSGKKGTSLKPRPLPDELPLGGYRGDPAPPHGQSFPAGDRVRLPGPDINQPAPLPILATPAPDRAALDDPTADFSAAAVQSAPAPARTNPAPFVKVALPDPFENRNAVRLREKPAERAEPVTGSPTGPGK